MSTNIDYRLRLPAHSMFTAKSGSRYVSFSLLHNGHDLTVSKFRGFHARSLA